MSDLRPARDFALQFGCKSRLKTLMPSAGIYGLRNLITNKIYVGSAVKIGHRCFRHREKLINGTHSNKYLQLAWNKYGEDNFIIEILEIVSEASLLLHCEQCWIDWLQSYNKDYGYNGRRLANSNLGLKFSDETKEKQRQSQLGHTRNKGRVTSIETKMKLSIALKGRANSPEHIAKRVEIMKGKPKSKAHKNAIAATLRCLDKWPHDGGNKCKCRECLDKKNVLRKIYNAS